MPEGRINVQTTGLFGVPEPAFEGHRCGKCMNPYTGGREDCSNNKTVRASQTVPYLPPVIEGHTFFADDGPVT